MRKEGFTEVPMMVVGAGNPMNFKQANDWINKWGDFYG